MQGRLRRAGLHHAGATAARGVVYGTRACGARDAGGTRSFSRPWPRQEFLPRRATSHPSERMGIPCSADGAGALCSADCPTVRADALCPVVCPASSLPGGENERSLPSNLPDSQNRCSLPFVRHATVLGRQNVGFLLGRAVRSCPSVKAGTKIDAHCHVTDLADSCPQRQNECSFFPSSQF